MATTPLRTYLHDIEGMIGAGQNDEAIAHCRYILQTFPKSISVYRLLGKAYLENQRYSDAADVLQRVLSALPDDFVAHVGMSIIREDESNLDASIWHMERAFETQPYNAAIQDELRRLYGRRDGMEPPKMRLTRGALARLYMKGDLYQQAAGELRAALAEDPQRPDLQVLLARVYYQAGQRVEAVETCSTLLKKLPFCLDANIILGAILPETERAQDAENYRQRAITLEPYFAKAASKAQTADNVPTSAIVIEKLLYTPGIAAAGGEGQPAWATSLGVSFKDGKEEETLPEWLSSSIDLSAQTEGEPTGEVVSPFSEAETPGVFPWETPSDEIVPTTAEPADQEDIPEWMKEAGWAPSTGEAKEGPVTFDLEEEAGAPEGGELAPADIPEWLREAAPPGVLEHPPVETGGEPVDEVLPWLQETPPGPTDTIATWLSTTKAEVPPSAEEIPPALPAELFQQLESEGEGLADLGIISGVEEAEIPDWLKESAAPAEAETTAASQEATEMPDWLQSAEPAAQATVEEELPDWLKSSSEETPAAPTDLPDWLTTESPPEEIPFAEVEKITADLEEIPDWLKSEATEPETTTLPEEPSGAAPAEVVESEETPTESGLAETPALAEEFPAWLKEVEAEIPEDAVETPQLKGVTEWLETVNTGDLATGSIGITDWLSQVDADQETTAAEPGPSAVELFPWMRESKDKESEEITPTQEGTEALPAEELPDWMREIEAGAPGEPATDIQSVTEAETSEEIPPSGETVPGVAMPAFEGEFPPGLDLSDQDAALAWLEGLAAKQGVPQEELITTPEVRQEIPAAPIEEVPDWMKEIEAEVPLELAPTAEAVPAETAEDIPDWLKEVEAEIPEEVAPTAEAEAEPAEEIPDWLKEAEAEVPEEETPAAEAFPGETVPTETAPTPESELPPGLDLSDQNAALAWLESLAAKQGVPQEELFATPEERQETPPTLTEEVSVEAPAAPAEAEPEWLKEAKAETEPVEEIPDWLKEVEVEVSEEEAPAAETIPGEAAPVEAAPIAEGEFPPGLDLSDQDAALAWLEGLAARQGVPQEELITTPEERQETPPAWTMEVSAEIPAEPVEEVPGWLKEAAMEVEEPTVPELQEPVVSEVLEETAPTEEIPDWLKEMAAEVQEPAVAEVQEPPVVEVQELAVAEALEEAARGEEIPDWLKEMAAETPEAMGAETQEPAGAETQEPIVAEVPKEVVSAVETAPGEETPSEIVPTAVEEVPDWLTEELAEPAPAALEAPPVETPPQTTEWIKETEIPQWMEETDVAKREEKVETEAELPDWIAEAAAQDTDMAWVPPQVSEPEKGKAAPQTLTDINSASVGELERLPGIGFVLAQSIINHRESQGPFRRIEDLFDVPGIGQGTIDVLKDWITIQPVPVEIPDIEEIAPLDPDHVILKRARNAIHQGDIPVAIKQYDQILRKLVLLNEIILDLQDALYRYPVDISIWQTLGDAYMRNNQLQDALDAYTKAEELLR